MNKTIVQSFGRFISVSVLVFAFSASLFGQCLGTTTSFSFIADSIQRYVVPPGIAEIRIVARGGSGGDGVGVGGRGALVESYIPVSPGMVLNVLVGGRGSDGTGNFPGGGGGGSFVWEGASNLFVAAAGGGGGGGSLTALGTNNAGNAGGIDLVGMLPTPPLNSGGVGGMTGGGGGNGGIGGGAGGAGFLNNGTNGLIGSGVSPTGGQAIVSGGDGGTGFVQSANIGGAGGFGGGAGGGLNGGGGGGGYNGGGGGAVQTIVVGIPPSTTRHGGGGGGSFVIGSGITPLASVATVSGNGSIEITCTAEVPTMGQWGIISLLLLISIFAVVYMYNHQLRSIFKRQ